MTPAVSNREPPIMLFVFILTFGIFLAVSIRSGAAFTGKAADGHYYVGQHGTYKEVSRGWYAFSASLTALIGLEIPVLAYTAMWCGFRERKQSIYHPASILGILLALLVGGGFFYSSIRCIAEAFR